MYTSLGQSSEIYHVHRESLAPLPQQEFNLPFASIDCDVVVLLACPQTQNKDTIIYLKGPDILDKKFIATRFFSSLKNLFSTFLVHLSKEFVHAAKTLVVNLTGSYLQISRKII